MNSPTTGEPFAIMKNGEPHWTGKVELIESKLEEPLHWRRPRRVFVNSMSDLFHEALSREDLITIWAVMLLAEHHTMQVLTKRHKHMLDSMSKSGPEGFEQAVRDRAFEIAPANDNIARTAYYAGLADSRPWPLPNVWLGVSVEDQATADERIPLLLQTPAAVRFVSYEPALGPVDFSDVIYGEAETVGTSGYTVPRLDWLIVGAESGPGARPFDLAWARSARDQCADAGVAFFMKQTGHYPAESGLKTAAGGDLTLIHRLRDKKGVDMAEWPEDLRIRQFPRPLS
jgi:protein gp37